MLSTPEIRPTNHHSPIHEIQIIWQVIVRDIPAALLPIVLFSLAAWHTIATDYGALPVVLVHSVVYAFMYTWTFCLANQLAGVEEDRLNKPNRPLVTGAITYRGAWVRWTLSMVLYLMIGWLLGVMEWVLLWQVVTIFHNFGGFSKNWIGKNICMSLGTLSQLAAAWQMTTPVTAVAWRWIILLALIIFPLVSLQDLRDMVGDLRTGRSTFPIAMGEAASRTLLGIGFAVLPLITFLGFMQPIGVTATVLLAQLMLTFLSLIIAIRIMQYRTAKADHHTYMLFCWWYCFLLAGGIVLL
jgi:4-hydroxybenzoate polyprenyltransferase